jgi:hypothetical protein
MSNINKYPVWTQEQKRVRNEITWPSAQKLHSLRATSNLTGQYAGPLSCLPCHEVTHVALSYLWYTIYYRLCYEFMNSALPLTGHTLLAWRRIWKAAKNSAAKPATDQNSHRSIPRTCNMEVEVTSVDLIRRSLNLMLLSEIIKPLFYTRFFFFAYIGFNA